MGITASEGLVYINGAFVPAQDATVSVFDRGFLFGDGVYEVIPVIQGKLVDEAYSVERLSRSLEAIDMAWPCGRDEYLATLRELVTRNQLVEGSVYVQVTRGVAKRDFAYPKDTPTTLMMFSAERNIMENPAAESGVSVVTVPDLRWKRRDIKSLNLLAQCMAKQEAAAQSAFEAWMTEDDMVTEGGSSSAFIVSNGVMVTRPLSRTILPGIRRRVILELCESEGIRLEQRAFSVEEALAADEAMLSSATTLILPVTSIDGHTIGDGSPGPVTRKLRELYKQHLQQEAAAKSQ